MVSPKLLYENLINFPRIQEQLRKHPNHKLFDGVGFSSLEALGFHARRLGRKAVVVMAHEHVPDDEVFERYDIEVIHGDKPGEEGYVEKQGEVLSQRNDLIPIRQALYGAQGLAPVGNAVVSQLEKLCISLDETYWCIASGSNLYGIGTKIKSRFGSQIVVVEPKIDRTIDPRLDLSNPEAVKSFARKQLRNYSLDDWDGINSGVFPLHIKHPNRYLLVNWLITGKVGFDSTRGVTSGEVKRMQERLRDISPDSDWTKTTALTMVPAIKAAKKGKNVLVMSYGKYQDNKIRDMTTEGIPVVAIEKIPWIRRDENTLQRIAATTALAGWLTVGGWFAVASYTGYRNMVEDAPVFNGFAVVGDDGETWISRLNKEAEEK